jgi:alkylated DNA nucleotide flippase Atl1
MSRITHLFLKKVAGKPRTPVLSVTGLRGYGLEGDLHAHPISPRQVLVTRKEDLDELDIVYGALMENIIVEGVPANAFQPGALLAIGENLQIRLTFHCEPCKEIADVVPSLKAVRGKRGILGVVLEDGQAMVGDLATCIPGRFKPLSEVPFGRFLEFIRQVPPGKVVTYKMVTRGMGVAEGYLRAIPKYIEKAMLADAETPVHRIVDERGGTIQRQVPQQLEMLKREGVALEKREDLFSTPDLFSVSLSKYRWPGASLYLG